MLLFLELLLASSVWLVKTETKNKVGSTGLRKCNTSSSRPNSDIKNTMVTTWYEMVSDKLPRGPEPIRAP